MGGNLFSKFLNIEDSLRQITLTGVCQVSVLELLPIFNLYHWFTK